ncbi:MAG TPA: SDR family oxidoreductase [Longimicrobium sp.]|nr:SDR family oxidoreductase [Longimicrobium sp.]
MADGNGRRTALVTGASGGIGAELARLFARDGWEVVLVARSRDELEKVGRELAQAYGARCHVVPADLADPTAPQAVHDAVQGLGVQVEALVNNAGFGLMGSFVDTGGGEPVTELGRELEMLQVNVVALTHLSKLFLPAMVQRRRGYLLNVASTAAFQPGPLMAVYYASKAYVLSFSEALSVELAGTGVTATALCPGATRTGFQATANMESSRLFRLGHVMTAAQVAEAGYNAMRAGRSSVIPGAANRVMAAGARLVPRSLAARMAKKAQERA